VFGNGYNNTVADGSPSATGNAVLYIVDIETGRLIKKLDTGVGTADDPTGKGRPNGLATPAAVDINGDSQIDYVFAGDLLGNVWKFDLSSSNPNDWRIAHGGGSGPQPLFTARDPTQSTLAQPITSRPEIIRGPRGVGMMVLFGTGKYLETSDISFNANEAIQSYYGLIDPNTGKDSDRIGNLGTLIEQTIEGERTVAAGGRSVNLRITSRNPLKADSRGWYLRLPAGEGERVVSNTTVRAGRAIFTTLIPSNDPCGFGGKSWLMELDAMTGGRLTETPFDVNNDGVFDQNDLVLLENGSAAASGIQLDSGIAPTPGVLLSEDGTKEYKYSPGTNGNISVVVENPGKGASGRQSWRQIR
jgi:type IV pilus assembly protein PilY1